MQLLNSESPEFSVSSSHCESKGFAVFELLCMIFKNAFFSLYAAASLGDI
jgi:hypothetical protein